MMHTGPHTYNKPLNPFLYNCIGSHRRLCYPSPSCVWCSVARFFLCRTGHLSRLPHCIYHHTSCIQVSVHVTFMNSLCSSAISSYLEVVWPKCCGSKYTAAIAEVWVHFSSRKKLCEYLDTQNLFRAYFWQAGFWLIECNLVHATATYEKFLVGMKSVLFWDCFSTMYLCKKDSDC